MHSNTHYNRKKGIRQASFDSEDEGTIIADEQAHLPLYNTIDQEEFFQGTQEHDQEGRNGIQGFVSAKAFQDKESLAFRKNRFVLNNNTKHLKSKVYTTQNSISRKDKINVESTSPIPMQSQNNSTKNMAFASAQKPAIQNLPPSIVLSSKQYKLNSTTLIKGTHTVTNSFVIQQNNYLKNKNSFADQVQAHPNTTKCSPVIKQVQKSLNFGLKGQQIPSLSNQNVRQSFKSNHTQGSGNRMNQNYIGSHYNTLNQNVKSQIMVKKQQTQIENINAQQLKLQKNMTIKTKCVSLEVSQERNNENSQSSYFTTNLLKNKIRPTKIQSIQGKKIAPAITNAGTGTLKIKRKPMISQTMKNSKQGSLNSTPTRPLPITMKNQDELNKNPSHHFKQGSLESTRMDIKSPPTINSVQNNDSLLMESIHNIQFTRNTQANSKTVSNVAQVLHPVQQANFDTGKKNLSHTKSVALSIQNPDSNKGQSRISSICNSLTHLNKNINLRTDKRSQGNPIDDIQSKRSSSRGDTLGVIHSSTPFKPSNTGSINQLKKLKGYVSSEAMSPHTQMTSSPSQVTINPIGKTNKQGVSFTKHKLGTKFTNQQSITSAKNMNIHESFCKKTLGMSQKLNLGSAIESVDRSTSKGLYQPQMITTSNPGQINARIISNYVSKTTQVSAYASKNNSNNSSVARGDNLNPVIQHRTLGQRINAVFKNKKAPDNSDQDQFSNAQTSKQSVSNFNIGNSSMSLKDKQLSFTISKNKHIGVKTTSIGDSNSGALKQVTNAPHVQSSKQQIYATVGSKAQKNTGALVRKGAAAQKLSFGGQISSQSQNFLSISNTNLKPKKTVVSFKQDVKKLEVFRSANALSSLSKHSKTQKNGNINILKISKKISNRLSHTKPADNQDKRQKNTRQNNEDNNSHSPHESAVIFNSTTSKSTNQPKKQFQPSQAKNSMRSNESYRRAGFSSIQLSQSPHKDEVNRPSNNYSTRQPQAPNYPLFSFNDIKEEVKETESQPEVKKNKNPTFNIENDLIQSKGTFKQKERSPMSTKIKINHDDTENSMMMQIKEYKTDIKNLKKTIIMYFKQYGEMQGSACPFYRIGRVLGRGAFGKVNLACHKVTEHLVAIKALEKKVLDNEKNTKKRVMQEIAILKQSNHHNVVRLYDSFETHKHICFVMELCQGGDLLSYVRKRRKLKEDNAKYLFKQLIDGLNYIHTQKFVIHRDIKLDNILLDASGKIKICDFGVSKQVKSERERMYEQCGTPAYIAPEVSNKQKGYKGFKADMWSAGVCLYVMLIGTVPFRASSMKELHELIRKGKYSLQGELLSNEAKNLLSSLINVNYHKRLSAKDTLEHPWFKKSQDGTQAMNYNRDNLSQVIFTQKEIETIQKDYITRLEKLKKQRLRKGSLGSPHHTDRDPQKNISLPNNTMTFDDDFLFTEHNLDTKEDQKQDFFDNTKNISSLFNKNKQIEFQKFQGLIVKKQVYNEYAPTEEKNLSEKSIIFCPFNSSFSQFDEEHPELFDWPECVKESLQPKKSKIIKYSKKCRDLNREYECNNNADLDNGVYNAFVNEQELEAEKNQKLQVLTEDDQMPTQSQHQSSSDSYDDSCDNISFQNSDTEDMYKNGKAPQNSFVLNEISIHESMQRGHENQWVVNVGHTSAPSKISVNDKLIDYTIELFKYNVDKQNDVYQIISKKLKSGLEMQDLNYLTAAYYLSQKYDKNDE